jgi:hypothetical protein
MGYSLLNSYNNIQTKDTYKKPQAKYSLSISLGGVSANQQQISNEQSFQNGENVVMQPYSSFIDSYEFYQNGSRVNMQNGTSYDYPTSQENNLQSIRELERGFSGGDLYWRRQYTQFAGLNNRTGRNYGKYGVNNGYNF